MKQKSKSGDPFAGEPPYIPFLWEHMVAGTIPSKSATISGCKVHSIFLQSADKGLFPELRGFISVALWESPQHVHHVFNMVLP